MQYVCDADQNTWFRIETDAEAINESRAMAHAVEKYFRQAREQATKSYVPPRSGHYIEQNIGLKAHIRAKCSMKIPNSASAFAAMFTLARPTVRRMITVRAGRSMARPPAPPR